MPILISLVVFALVVSALVDIIMRSDHQVRHLPKVAWVLLVVFLPLIGSVLWFALGREWSERPASAPEPRADHTPPSRTASTLSTEQQLAELEREITAYEEMERIRHLEAELERRRKQED